MSFLTTVGKDIKSVFSWLGSTKGQAVVQTAEGAAEVVATAAGVGGPVAAGLGLLNNWMGEAVKLQAMGEAAGATPASNPIKAAAVISTMEPELLSFLQANGYVTTNVGAQAASINTAAVALLNALGTPVTPATASPANA
jgi:hypothetical protein